MDHELETRLQEIEEKLDETQRVVKKIRKVQKRAGTVRAAYWIFIILLAFGAFYFIRPVVAEIKELYNIGTGYNDGALEEFFRQVNE